MNNMMWVFTVAVGIIIDDRRMISFNIFALKKINQQLPQKKPINSD